MTTAVLRQDHRSSKWNKSPRSLHRSIVESAQHVDIITVTEAADGDRPKALDLDGWTTVQDVRPWVEGECALLARDDVWEVVRWQAYEVAPDLGPGNKVTALMVLLRHIETGRTLGVVFNRVARRDSESGYYGGYYRADEAPATQGESLGKEQLRALAVQPQERRIAAVSANPAWRTWALCETVLDAAREFSAQ